MKLTDFALIFVGVFLPVMIIAYVNTTFAVKAEKNEMYYKNIINSATQDAVNAMKQVENDNIDYGYSGIVDKKVSINAAVAIKSFYNSLSHNFGITCNDKAIERLKMYIPVVAVIDYDGIYIHSIEEFDSGEIKFTTKPKIKYTLVYKLVNDGGVYKMLDVDRDEMKGTSISSYLYEITFTMDDYVYLNVWSGHDVIVSNEFYLTDERNNSDLIYGVNILSNHERSLKQEIVKKLSYKRQTVIAEIGMKQISYAINNHNNYARLSDIKYEFTLSVESDEEWYETMIMVHFSEVSSNNFISELLKWSFS